MNGMDGAFQEGDAIKAISGPYVEGIGGIEVAVGKNGVTRIIVTKAAGPMGWYAVAQVFRGDDLTHLHPMHMLDCIVL